MLLLLPLLGGLSALSIRSAADSDVRWTRSTASKDDGFVELGFSVEPSEAVTRKGGVAHFHCAAFGPTAERLRLSWRRDGLPLNTNIPSSKLSLLENGTLVVRDVEGRKGAEAGDEGAYQCVVALDRPESTWTALSRKAQLRVQVLPRFVEQPEDSSVLEGESVVFPCRTDSVPAPSVRWYKDGALVSKADTNLVVIPHSGSLEIMRAKAADSGSYHCKVSTSDKYRESSEGKLTVKATQLLSEPYAPRFVMKPSSQTVSEGSSVVLECSANGYPEAEMQWLKDERRLEIGGRLRREGRSSLVINSVGPSDGGVYTCRASSSLDSQDASATLQIQVPPTFAKAPENVLAKETSDVELECAAEGEPGPAISWYKNGELIRPSEYFVMEGSSLKVLGLVKSDSGVYQCMAENPAGSVQASAQLVVQLAERKGGAGKGVGPAGTSPTSELPEATGGEAGQETAALPPPSEPQALKAARWTSRSVSLAWAKPAQTHGPITAYAVFYKEAGSDRERVLNTTRTEPSMEVTGLQPGTTYAFRVVAYNGNGHGLSSAPLKLTTKTEEAVPGAVRNLAALPTSPKSVELRWEPPESDIPVAFYKLIYAKSPEPDVAEQETEIPVTRNFYELHDLAKFAWYSFRVEAYGGPSEGSGPSSPPVRVRTLSDVPSGTPIDVKVEPSSAQSLVISWKEPAEAERNGLITGYRIRYKEAQRGSEGRTLMTDGSAREQRINGLAPGESYMVRVSAKTVNGSGPASAWQRASTYDRERGEETVPGPPTSLRVQARPRSILISWTPPLEDGLLTRGFMIGWGINVPDVEHTKVDGTRSYYTIENLTPNRNYIVSLRAFNSKGNGFPIYETVRTRERAAEPDADGSADAAAPGAADLKPPIGLMAKTKSATAIRLSWSDRDLPPPRAPGESQMPRDGRVYQIRFKSNYLNGRYHYINSSETAFTVEGLKPATEYEFNVEAAFGATSSGWSMTAGNRTDSAAPTSAPRDLTAIPTEDPTRVTLSWQPPQYSNGHVDEYLIYYTERPGQADSGWHLESARGDDFTLTISDLLPATVYFFKIQAVSEKGYGPLSAVIQRRTGRAGPGRAAAEGGDSDGGKGGLFEGQMGTILVAGGAAAVLILLIILILVIWCCRRRSSGRNSSGYTPGKKSAAGKMEMKPPPDLWIHHDHARRGSADELEAGLGSTRDNSAQDLHHHHLHQAQHSPAMYHDPARYQTHSDMGGGSRMSQSAVDYADSTLETRQVGRARPIRHAGSSTNTQASSESSKGTLTRSYHQSSGSLGEQQPHSARQRTPNVVYTGPRHGQHPSSVDLDGSGLTPTPPPSLPPGSALVDSANRTLTRSGNPLKSFGHLTAGLGPPPGEAGHSPTPARALVRPVPITVPFSSSSPLRASVGTSATGKPAGIVIGTKAVLSPRPPHHHYPAPLHHQHGSYSDANAYSSGKDTDNELHHSYSTEDLNVQMENLDTLMEDLHAMSKNEFNVP